MPTLTLVKERRLRGGRAWLALTLLTVEVTDCGTALAADMRSCLF